jgi:tryptophanyl-tRNA synthetase
MSKSDADLSGCILLTDDEKTIEKKIKRAVTDSGSQVAAAADKPAVTNLLVIMSVISGKPIEELEQKYAGKGYGVFKDDLAHEVLRELRPIQHTHAQLMKPGNDQIDKALEHGWWRASELANAKLGQVKELLGLI